MAGEIFISYRRTDQAWARLLHAQLQAEGVEAWYDAKIGAGQDWRSSTAKALEASQIFVLLFSAKAAQSDEIAKELAAATHEKKLIIPVRLENIAPKGAFLYDLASRNWINAYEDTETRLAELAMDLAHLVRTGVPALTSLRDTANMGERPVFSISPAERNEPERHKEEGSGRLSICVLPFANMSGEVEQEYFSDGISEDIITDLGKVSALAVISRNSAFRYKGKHVDLPKIARELNVSHLLEGSVRKAGGRVRITAQLIEGKTNGHIWAERYDRDLNDIFALQAEVSEAIVSALKLKLLPEEKKAIGRRGTNSLDAYNLYLMARQPYLAGQVFSPRGSEAIIRLCKRAIEIDAGYAQAWSLLALTEAINVTPLCRDRGMVAAERALTLNDSLAEAHVAKGRVLFNLARYDEAAQECEKALSIDSESPEANMNAGLVFSVVGMYEKSIPRLVKAATLIDAVSITALLLRAYRGINDEERERRTANNMLERADLMMEQQPGNTNVMSVAALAFISLGDTARAKEMIDRVMLLKPEHELVSLNLLRALALLNDVEAAADMAQSIIATAPKVIVDSIMRASDNTALADNPRFNAMLAAAAQRLAEAETR